MGLALALLIALPILGDHWRLRYADPYYGSVRDMIFAQSGPVQVATLGTSRAMRAIVGPELAHQLSRHLSEPQTVFDLSVSGGDMGLRYLITRDLLERHDVDLLLIEYKEARSAVPHPNYLQLARVTDILRTPLEASVPWDQLGQRLRLVEHKYGQVIGRALTDTGRIFAPLQERPAATTDPSLPYFVWPEIIVKSLSRSQQDSGPQVNPGWPFGTALAKRQEAYMRKVIDLTERHGTRIVFFYVPALGDPPVDRAFAERFEAEFGVPLFLPDKTVHDRINPSGFADSSHLNSQGMRIYIGALARALVEQFAEHWPDGRA